MRVALIWAVLALAVFIPVVASGFSPLLQWRDPIYIVAGFAGVIGMAMMLVQPLLAAGVLPLPAITSRRLHGGLGATLVLAVLIHVGGLWLTSPPDVIDVLLFRSPTPFGVWGVIAMWAIFTASLLALFRRKIGLRVWRWGHSALVTLAVLGTVLHALQIDGTMEIVTKVLLAALIVAALCVALARRRVWAIGLRRR